MCTKCTNSIGEEVCPRNQRSHSSIKNCVFFNVRNYLSCLCYYPDVPKHKIYMVRSQTMQVEASRSSNAAWRGILILWKEGRGAQAVRTWPPCKKCQTEVTVHNWNTNAGEVERRAYSLAKSVSPKFSQKKNLKWKMTEEKSVFELHTPTYAYMHTTHIRPT